MGKGILIINTNRILFLLFIIAVFIDAANGILQKKMGVSTPIGTIYRGTLFFYLFFYLFQNRHKLIIGGFIVFVVFCLFIWTVLYNASLFKELEFLIRYSYFFVILNFFYLKRDYINPRIVYKYVFIYGLVISSIILICYFTGFGISSYGEGEYGWGEKGLFIATNDIGLTILCSLICSCIYHNRYNKKKKILFCIGLIASGGVLVGSRVCFIFIPFTLLLYALYKAKKTKNKLVVIVAVSLMVYVAVYIGFLIYSMLDDYALAKFTQESFENARTLLTDEAKKHIACFDALSFLIGKGANTLHNSVGKGFGLDGERFVEADYYEIVGSYGYLLGGIILLSYLSIVIRSVRCWLRRKDSESFLIMYMTVSFIVIAYFAGHAVANMMAVPILAVSTILLYRKKLKR